MRYPPRIVLFFAIWTVSFVTAADQEPLYDAPEAIEWQEAAVTLPAFPTDENLVEFPVGSMSKNRFSIDKSSLTIGADGVVRFVLVVKAPGGGTNVTFEGIHCQERRFKVYAIGHDDHTWSKLRSSEWILIENKPLNRHHAVLNRDVFCPSGAPIGSVQEGLNALRRVNLPSAGNHD